MCHTQILISLSQIPLEEVGKLAVSFIKQNIICCFMHSFKEIVLCQVILLLLNSFIWIVTSSPLYPIVRKGNKRQMEILEEEVDPTTFKYTDAGCGF